MADENRMVTFEYAKANYNAFKKQTIPNTKECMTRSDVDLYLNANPISLEGYSANRLVPRSKITPNLPFAFQFYYTENRGTVPNEVLNVKNTNSWNLNMFFDYENGKGKLYTSQANLGSTKTIAGTNITYKVILLLQDPTFTLGLSGFERVRIKITNPNKTTGTFTFPVTLYANEAMTESVTIYYTAIFASA